VSDTGQHEPRFRSDQARQCYDPQSCGSPDCHLQHIAEHGRAAWQKASGYTNRARAEAAIGRFKQVIGDGLRSRTDDRRAIEVDIAVHALNRMSEFGRPDYVRSA